MNVAETNIKLAMQMEIQRVLMKGELDVSRCEQLKVMLAGARDFIRGAFSEEREDDGEKFGPGFRPLSNEEMAARIQAERYRQLGFTPEMVENMRAASERERNEATEGLIRSASVHGVGEDEDEEQEVEEVLVRQPPAVNERSIWLSLGLVKRVIDVLLGTDGDVVDHLIEIVNNCNVTDEVRDDAVLPVDVGLVHLVAYGLTDPKIVAVKPEAKALAAELSDAVIDSRHAHADAAIHAAEALKEQLNPEMSRGPIGGRDGN
jgi:hypothetical protein